MKDKRKKRNRVDEEANFIGDIVRLLFALSIAVVTIVAGFILFKNISGFSLPNLKETEASTEQTKESKETETTKESSTEESTKESIKEQESETKKESSSSKENGVVGESPTAATKKAESSKAETGSAKSPSDNISIGEAPKTVDGDVVEEGPGVH